MTPSYVTNFREPLRARPLSAGAKVGIFSPSSPVTDACLTDTVTYWESRGYGVEVSAHASDSLGGYLAGEAHSRAEDLNAMLRSEDIGLIVSSMGGKGANQLLPLIDYEAMRRQPKLFIGLSDPSLLVVAIHAMTGVVTFHGPTGMAFGTDRFADYSQRAMFSALTSTEPLGTLEAYSEWSVLRAGPAVTGRLIGGHLRTLRSLIGTPYEPDWDGAVLFLEEIDVEFHDIDTAITHLRLAGVLDRIAGLIFGRSVNVREEYWESTEHLSDVILRTCDGTEFPILYNVDVGHTDETLTLPVGCRATLDPDDVSITIVDSAVV